jgi:hypothetical protein
MGQACAPVKGENARSLILFGSGTRTAVRLPGRRSGFSGRRRAGILERAGYERILAVEVLRPEHQAAFVVLRLGGYQVAEIQFRLRCYHDRIQRLPVKVETVEHVVGILVPIGLETACKCAVRQVFRPI